jgi:hypothetical protein
VFVLVWGFDNRRRCLALMMASSDCSLWPRTALSRFQNGIMYDIVKIQRVRRLKHIR